MACCQDYLAAPDINDPNFQHGVDADFIHTENIVLLDKKQRIGDMMGLIH